MKVKSNEKTQTNTVELEIEVSAEELGEEIKKVFERESKDIVVPGFRKGKAPMKTIEKMYGENIFLEDAVNDLYPKMYSDAIEQTGLEPVATAEIEVLTVSRDEGFTFKAIVTTKPEIEITNYKGLEVEKVDRKATDEEVETEIKAMQERGARLIEIADRPAKLDDTAIIDFEGFVDDAPFEGGKAEGHEIILGSHSFIDTFEDQIVGKNIGEEFDVNVTFPEEYHSEDLAGKPALFKVTLHELKGKELPELDDEFAKDVSEFDTFDELKADIKKNLQEQKEKHSSDELENKLVLAAIENLEGEIPDAMYETRVDEMVHEFSHQLSSQGMNMDLYLQYTGMDMETFRKTFREQAESQVKIRLALEKIAETEKVEPSDEDYENEYKKIADMYKMEVKNVKDMISKDQIALDIKSNKAIDIIRDAAKITEISEEEAEKRAKAKEEAEAKKEEAKAKKEETEAKKEETKAKKEEAKAKKEEAEDKTEEEK